MSGQIALYAQPVIEPLLKLNLSDIEEYRDLKFQKRTHGGIKVVDGEGHRIDVIRKPKERGGRYVNYFDPEFIAAYCMMATSEASRYDFDDFLQSYIRDGDVLYSIKRHTNIFNPERGLYDAEENKLTDECIRMMHFSDESLFDSAISRLKILPRRNVYVEGVGTIELPSTWRLYEVSDAFQNFFNSRNKRNRKCIIWDVPCSPLFELKISPPESPVGSIERAELLSNNGSGRKAYIAKHNPTPLGHEFYNYCSSETEEFDKLFERKYGDYGLLEKDGNLSNNGATILSILHAKQSIA